MTVHKTRPTNCKNCGAVLKWNNNKCVCDYCGTEYESVLDTVTTEYRIISTQPKWVTLQSRVVLSKDALIIDGKPLERYVIKDLANELAREMIENKLVDITREEDAQRNELIYRTNAKVIIPTLK